MIQLDMLHVNLASCIVSYSIKFSAVKLNTKEKKEGEDELDVQEYETELERNRVVRLSCLLGLLLADVRLLSSNVTCLHCCGAYHAQRLLILVAQQQM